MRKHHVHERSELYSSNHASNRNRVSVHAAVHKAVEIMHSYHGSCSVIMCGAEAVSCIREHSGY